MSQHVASQSAGVASQLKSAYLTSQLSYLNQVDWKSASSSFEIKGIILAASRSESELEQSRGIVRSYADIATAIAI